MTASGPPAAESLAQGAAPTERRLGGNDRHRNMLNGGMLEYTGVRIAPAT